MMKLRTLLLSAALLPIVGCGAVNGPPTPPAPGYSSTADQTIGQSLAALNAFVSQEKVNYARLTADQQAKEKTLLNAFIDATNVANATYTAFHAGTATLAQAQTAYQSASNAQSALAAQKAGK